MLKDTQPTPGGCKGWKETANTSDQLSKVAIQMLALLIIQFGTNPIILFLKKFSAKIQ